MSKPNPIINGLSLMPLSFKAFETAQGSPSHASIPSVTNMITFLQFSQGGKSLFPACSNDKAMGVVPLHSTPLILSLTFVALAFEGANGTSSFVSLQS